MPFSLGEDGCEDGTLAVSSDSHDSLQRGRKKNKKSGRDEVMRGNERGNKLKNVRMVLKQNQFFCLGSQQVGDEASVIINRHRTELDPRGKTIPSARLKHTDGVLLRKQN